MKRLLLALAVLICVSGCDSTPNEIKAALWLCEAHGGLKTYLADHRAVCHNGVIISSLDSYKNLPRIEFIPYEQK
jgi:uncharacterized protein YceK